MVRIPAGNTTYVAGRYNFVVAKPLVANKKKKRIAKFVKLKHQLFVCLKISLSQRYNLRIEPDH